MNLTALALASALVVPAAAGEHDNHGGTPAAAVAPIGPPLTDEEFDQRIDQWKRDINNSDYHPKQKVRLTREIDDVHRQFHDDSDHFKTDDPRGQVRDSDMAQFRGVVKKDADLERAVWQIGMKHGLDPANNKAQLDQLRAAIAGGYETGGAGGVDKVVGSVGGFQLKPEERAQIRDLAKDYIDTMHSFGGSSPAAGVLHDAWHQISTKVDPQGGGLPYVPPDLQTQHNNNFIKDQPQDPYPLVFSGNRDLLNGDPSSALSKAGAALALDPNNVQALDLSGAANYQLKNNADAAAAAQKALGLDPKDETAQAILNFAGKAGLGSGPDLTNAADGFAGEKSTGQMPDGVLGFARGAGGGLTASAEKGSAQSAMLTRDALAALAVGDTSGAIAALDRVLALDPNNVRALNARALAMARQRRYAEALRDAEAALRLDPKNQLAMNTRAAVLSKLKRFEEAAAQARAAIAADPNDANAWRNLAEALAGLGDRAGSLAALRKAAELDARFKPLLENALQLPADADMNLLFADDAPAGAAVAAARGAGGPSRKWDFGFIAAAAAVGGALLVAGLLPLFSRKFKDAWRKFTRHQVVRASEVRYVESLIKGQYRLGGELASGDAGTVYEGLDIKLDRPVAIWRMRDELKMDQRERARFVQEAKLAAALHHRGIVDIFAIADDGGDVYLVFEYFKGKALYELVSSRGRLTLDEALPILRGVVDALEYAHGRGVIHRDLKPSNIMLGAEGSVKVVGFGISRAAKDARAYMAPEQEKGLVRKESDVYSLALCLYEMLTGRAAFSGTGAGMLMNKLDKSYAPVSTLAPELPPGIDQVFAAALDPDPAKRLASPKELLARLAAAAGRTV